MIYMELLAIDHLSEHRWDWAWNLASLGALNRRHGIIRVNSQIRCEAQRCFYGSIPWVLRIKCRAKDPWELRERKVIVRILTMLTAAQLSYIRELRLVYSIGDLPANSSRIFLWLVCRHLPAVQRLNITWFDRSRYTTWHDKKTSFLNPLAALRNVSSVSTREGDYQNGPKNDEEFAKLINDILAERFPNGDRNFLYPLHCLLPWK